MCDEKDAFKLVRTLDPSLWFWTAPNLRNDSNNELEHWKSHRILTALVITSGPCIDFFASESNLYNGMIQVQQHVTKWKPFQELSLSKAYKDLKSKVDELTETSSMPEEALSVLEYARSLGKELSRKIESSGERDPTAFARELLREVENARKGIENAATSIYKVPSKREDEEAEPDDIPMPDYDNRRVIPPDDRATDGYYFVILDHTALETFLGPKFFHLCRVMKEVGVTKEKNRARAEEETESGVLRCPVGCERNRYDYKYKARLDKHIRKRHSEHEPAVKRRKLDSRVVRDSSRVGNDDCEDVEMAGIEEIG